MTRQIGLALIGPGRWGKRLAAAVRQTSSLRLVTCFGRDEARREAFAAEFGCQAAPSFEAAIEHPQVQGVMLVTPNYVLAEQTLACARRGQHVYVEKPIADTLADGRAMDAACREAGVTLLVGHAFRRLGAARKVKQLIEAGTLGTVVLAEANFSLPGTLTPQAWRYYRDNCPGGPLMQLGVHQADTLQYWLGPVRQVQGSFARLVTPAEIDDIGVALLEFAGGARGTLTSSYVSPKTFYLRLFGTEANLHYETDMSVWPRAELMGAATRLTLQTKSGQEGVTFGPRDMLVEQLNEFARCILGETEPETGATEALAALEVIRGAIDSHQDQGKRFP
jgi:predicted dehydrogenase